MGGAIDQDVRRLVRTIFTNLHVGKIDAGFRMNELDGAKATELVSGNTLKNWYLFELGGECCRLDLFYPHGLLDICHGLIARQILMNELH